MLTTIHLAIVIATGLLVLYSDEQALTWVLGKQETLKRKHVIFLHNAISIGLACLLITGGFLYSRAPAVYLSESTFVVKMVTIAALILNTYAIDRLSHIACTRSFRSLSKRERLPLFVSGAVSFSGWATAVICGLLIS